jgi:hypothetical protein
MLIDIIGWIGSILVVFAYAMNIYGKLSSDSTWYYLLNIAGSIGLILNTLYHHAIPSCVVNIVWVAIALGALLKNARKAGKDHFNSTSP